MQKIGMANSFRADLHVHTKHSHDSLSEPVAVLEAAVKKGLSAVAITDHNGIDGALEAQKIAARRRMKLQVIAGEEVSTGKGDLLVYFVKQKIAPGSLSRVLVDAKKQGAVCCAAHPCDFARHGIALARLDALELAAIDAVESFNARATLASQNESARAFALSENKALLAGSDAHHPSEIGRAFAEFRGIRRLDSRNLLSAERRICGSLSPPYVHLFSRWAAFRKKLSRLFRPQR